MQWVGWAEWDRGGMNAPSPAFGGISRRFADAFRKGFLTARESLLPHVLTVMASGPLAKPVI
jgi:hypothetical protein